MIMLKNAITYKVMLFNVACKLLRGLNGAGFYEHQIY